MPTQQEEWEEKLKAEGLGKVEDREVYWNSIAQRTDRPLSLNRLMAAGYDPAAIGDEVFDEELIENGDRQRRQAAKKALGKVPARIRWIAQKPVSMRTASESAILREFRKRHRWIFQQFEKMLCR